MPDSPFDDYLDLVEAAGELGIHPQSLRRLIKQKRVPAVLFAGKYLIERDKLEDVQGELRPATRPQAHPPPALASVPPRAATPARRAPHRQPERQGEAAARRSRHDQDPANGLR